MGGLVIICAVVLAYLLFTLLVLALYAAFSRRAATPHVPAAG